MKMYKDFKQKCKNILVYGRPKLIRTEKKKLRGNSFRPKSYVIDAFNAFSDKNPNTNPKLLTLSSILRKIRLNI